MSTYRELRGLKVKYLAADPDPGAAGDVWYNSTTFELKAFVGRAAFHSSSPLSTARTLLGAFGTVPAGAVTGGDKGPARANETEEYNGTGWVSSGDLNTTRKAGSGTGTQTAGVLFGGSGPPDVADTEEYDGSSWTAGEDLPAARAYIGSAGTQTAGLVAGGWDGTSYLTTTQEYDGTNFADGNAMNQGRYNLSGCGTQTAALMMCGYPGSYPAAKYTESYDGTNWTAESNSNAHRASAAGDGTTTAAVIAGGEAPAVITTTETWDGSSWSTSPASLSTARKGTGGIGTSSNLVVAGGYSTDETAITEEYSLSFDVVTAGAWSSGGNLPQDSRGGGSFGTQTAGVYVGGLQYPSDTKNRTDEYNGSSWTNVNNLPTNYSNGNSCGTLTAGLIFGSQQNYGVEEQTFEYDGTDWTAGGSLPDIGPAYQQAGGGGTQTAAVACGGYGDPPPGVANVVEYDGSSWSANPNNLPASNYGQAGDGTSTALWIAGGYLVTTATLEFDGTSFTSSGAFASARPSGTGAGYGPQTNAIVSGGDASAGLVSEQYNGTAWATAPQMSTARKYGNGASRSAGSTTGWQAGGATPPNPNTNNTEEFTGETSAETASTIDFD